MKRTISNVIKKNRTLIKKSYQKYEEINLKLYYNYLFIYLYYENAHILLLLYHDIACNFSSKY